MSSRVELVISTPRDTGVLSTRTTSKGALLREAQIDDLGRRELETKTPGRILLVLDESGQWIGSDGDRLAQLQALVEEAAIKGLGRIWVLVTTHEDIGSILHNARAIRPDMKKIEDRFRFKWSLTTENIELVLEDRIFRKRIAGSDAVGALYDAAPGVLRGLGELAKVEGRRLPSCERDRFIAFYPFFPYQIHLIPDVVKSLRARGGRGEQLSGSTRTLLAITQDVLRAGRRPYLTVNVVYAAFILRCLELVTPAGRVAMVTQQSWMFLRSYVRLRALSKEEREEDPDTFGGLLRDTTIEVLAHLGPHAFTEIRGEVVNSVLFVLALAPPHDEHQLTAFRLIAPKSPEEKDRLLRDAIAAVGRAEAAAP